MYISFTLFLSSPEVTFTYVGQIFNQGINLLSCGLLIVLFLYAWVFWKKELQCYIALDY